MGTRIVTFLGIGDPDVVPTCYEPCKYRLERLVDGELKVFESNRTNVHDVASVIAYPDPVSLVVLGTEKTHDIWFTGNSNCDYVAEVMAHARGRRLRVFFEAIPDGETRQERWDIFRQVVKALSPERQQFNPAAESMESWEEEEPSEIVLDITHGWRAQPFFASSALAFVQSERRRALPASDQARSWPNIRVLYAQYDKEKGNKQIVPFWDLTQILQVLEWDAAIDGLIRFGRAGDLEALSDAEDLDAYREGTRTRKPLAMQADLNAFARAANRFCDALATARIPELMTKAAPALVSRINGCREAICRSMPLLEPQLDRLLDWASRATAAQAISQEGVDAGLRTAGLYKDLQRYAEMAVVLRETAVSAWTLQCTASDQLKQPGDSGFMTQRFDREWSLGLAAFSARKDPAKTGSLESVYVKATTLRNDIQHGAFRAGAQSSERIIGRPKKLEGLPGLLEELRGPIAQLVSESKVPPAGFFLNCSARPKASWPLKLVQGAEALGFGPVEDFPGSLPELDPACSVERLAHLADETASAIASMSARAAFVDGPFALALAIVARLQDLDIRCYTAVRGAFDDADGVEDGPKLRGAAWRAFPALSDFGFQ